jgi:hypothetical protein
VTFPDSGLGIVSIRYFRSGSMELNVPPDQLQLNLLQQWRSSRAVALSDDMLLPSVHGFDMFRCSLAYLNSTAGYM